MRDEPPLPKRVNQGDAGKCDYSKPIRGRHGQGEASGGRVVRPDSTPGKGTRGNGTTHENVGR